METLKKGSKGEDVKILQKFLGLSADGIFGQQTETAVIDFQHKNNLTADGIVGNKTWQALEYPFGKDSALLKICTKRQIKGIILHCSATVEGKDYSVNEIRRWHKNQGFSDIGYHYVIHTDGRIENGRDVEIAGAHTTNHNAYTIGICYIGGVDKNIKAKDTRTEAQKQSLVQLVKKLQRIYNLNDSNVHAHNEYANKACPSFSISDFRKEL